MRIPSDQRFFPAIPPLAAAPRSGLRPIPAGLYWLVALAVGSSFYVAIEPAPTDVVFAMLFVAAVVARGLRFPLDLNPLLSVGLIGFFAANAASLLASQHPVEGFLYWAVTTYLLVTWYLLVVLLTNYGEPMWELIRRAFLVAATIAALIGLISHFSTVLQDYLYVQSAYGERGRGSFKDPNVYAPFLCAALILVVNSMITRRLLSLTWIALLCLFSVEILGAFSRGGYVNLFVSLGTLFGVHLLLNRRDWLTRWFIFSFVTLLVVIPTLLVFLRVSGLEDFLWRRLQLQRYDDQRFHSQSMALEGIASSPLGVGPGQAKDMIGLGTHNVYLMVAFENGLIAVLCFLLFILTTLWIALRGTFRRGPFQDVYACCLAILAGIMANSLAIDSLHWRHFFLFLAIPVGLWQYQIWVTRAAWAADPAPRPQYSERS